MSIGYTAYNRGRDGLAEREEGSHRSTEQNDVVAVVDGFGEAVLVGVQAVEDARE